MQQNVYTICKTLGENRVTFCEHFDSGAVQKRAHLVDLKNMLQNENLVAKIRFGTSENEPSKVIFSYFDILQIAKIKL